MNGVTVNLKETLENAEGQELQVALAIIEIV